jgi:cytochrome b561
MSLKSTTNRYGSMAIAIHWTSAVLILFALIGGLIMANTADPAAKAMILPIHIALGGLALLLTLARIGWWLWGDKHPQPANGIPVAQEWAMKTLHTLLYVAILVMGSSGIAMIVLSGAIPALLAGAPVPDFSGLIPRAVHGWISKLLIVLLVGHIGAALWHQFVRGDRLLARMGVGAA